MQVKGPAGGFSNAYRDPKISPSNFYKKQGTVSKIHHLDDDSEFHTDDSMQRQTLRGQKSITSSIYKGDPAYLNRQRSKRILDRKVNFDRKETITNQKIKRVLTSMSIKVSARTPAA